MARALAAGDRVISGAAELVAGWGLTTVTVPAGVIATLEEHPDSGFSPKS